MTVAASFIGIDPGEVTGLAWVCLSLKQVRKGNWHDAMIQAAGDGRLRTATVDGSHDEDQAAQEVLDWIEARRDEVIGATSGRHVAHDGILLEDFLLREQTMDRTLLSPVRIGAKVAFGCWQRRRWFPDSALAYPHVQWMQPSQHKSVITNDRLKRWGLWLPGTSHERDALRLVCMQAREVD